MSSLASRGSSSRAGARELATLWAGLRGSRWKRETGNGARHAIPPLLGQDWQVLGKGPLPPARCRRSASGRGLHGRRCSQDPPAPCGQGRRSAQPPARRQRCHLMIHSRSRACRRARRGEALPDSRCRTRAPAASSPSQGPAALGMPSTMLLVRHKRSDATAPSSLNMLPTGAILLRVDRKLLAQWFVVRSARFEKSKPPRCGHEGGGR
jgi:hypothetical protein